MTNATDTAAFPVLERGGQGLHLTDPGMTMRDYFAAQVVSAVFHGVFEDWPTGIAVDAYRVADAMLKIREST